jgi:hypothetical protein
MTYYGAWSAAEGGTQVLGNPKNMAQVAGGAALALSGDSDGWEKTEVDMKFVPANGKNSEYLYQAGARTYNNPAITTEEQPVELLLDDVAIEKLGRLDKTTGYNSGRSLKIIGYADTFYDNPSGHNAASVRDDIWYSEKFDVLHDRTYKFSSMVKTDSIVDHNGKTGGAYMTVKFYDDNGSLLTTADSSTIFGTNGWTKLGGEVMAPETAVSAAVELCVAGRGTAWFDDVSFGEYELGLSVSQPSINFSDIYGHSGETLTVSYTVKNGSETSADVMAGVGVYEKGANRLINAGVTVENGIIGLLGERRNCFQCQIWIREAV